MRKDSCNFQTKIDFTLPVFIYLDPQNDYGFIQKCSTPIKVKDTAQA